MKLAADADTSDESGTTVATVTVNGQTTSYNYAENSACTTPTDALQSAWNNAAQKSAENSSDATLKLLESVDMGTSKLALENANSSIILEMNDGVILTSSYEYGVIQIKKGKLTMKSGQIVCDFINGRGVNIEDGEFILDEGKISGENMYYGVCMDYQWQQNAKFTMNGGTITASVQNSYGVYANYGTVDINNGTVTADGNGIYIGQPYANKPSTSFTMKNGRITGGYGVYVYGEANITGGEITGTKQYAVSVNGSKGGKANISGNVTKITSTASYAIMVDFSANVTINGNAKIEGKSGITVSSAGIVTIEDNAQIIGTGNCGVSLDFNNNDTTVNVTGGTIIGKQYGVKVETGKLVMSNGEVSATDYYGLCVSNSGNVDISGGKINGKSLGLWVWENSTGDVTISGGTFIGSTHSVDNRRGAVKNLLAEGCAYFKGETISEETRLCDDNILAKNNLAASDGYGTVTVAQVPLAITSQTDNQSWTYGDKTECVLTVQAKKTEGDSGDITYQWYQKDESSDEAITDATSDTYSLTNFNAGDYKYYCVITCGDYKVTSETIKVNILPKDVNASITGDFSKDKTYDGTTEVTGHIDISLEGVLNNDSVTATASSYLYDSSDAGERTITASDITLTGKSANNYKLSNDSATVDGNILPLDISSAKVEFANDISGLVYDGTQKEINVSNIIVQVNGNDRSLVKDTEYTLSGNTAANVGTYTCTITGKGNFTGEITKEWNISKCPITIVPDSNQFKEYGADDTELTYGIISGSVAENDVLEGVLIRAEGEDVGTYEITKSSNADTDNPNYNITVTEGVTFEIIPSSLEDSTITLSDAEYTYDGTEKKPDITINKNGMTLKKGIDYTEKYADNINAGIAAVTITAVENGNYVGTIKKEFSIIQATPEIYTAPSVADRVYNPFISLKDSDLTVGKVSVNGTWSWQSKDIVPTVDNNGYVAVFTPDDSNNYKTVTITIPVAVTKAVPYIASPPAAAAITNGDALNTSELTGGTVKYGNGVGQAGSEIGSTEVIAGVFTWKDASIVPATADSGLTEYTVVFTPSDSTNYSVAETKITVTVNEADKPQNTPNGNIIVTEPIISDDAPHADIVGTPDEIKEAVPLTEEEKAAVADGNTVRIYLKIEKKAVTQEEKQIIDEAREDYIIGEYIDISMFKQVDGKEESPVRQLNKKIEISLVVPENLRNKNNNLTRTYAIIRHHSDEDKAEILQGVYNEQTFTFTFATDCFSTYTIVYKDTEKQTGNVSYPIINGGGYATDFTQTSSPYPSVKPSAKPTAKPSMMPTAEPSQTPQISTAPDTSSVPTQEPSQDNVTPAPSKTPSDKTAKKDKLALNAGFKASPTGNKIKILWGKVSGADGYDVYIQYCGKKFNSRPSNSVRSGKVTKVSVKKINGKKLNLKKSYKLYVAAYKLVNGKKIIMCKSIIAHNAGAKSKKYTNVKDIKVKKVSYTLKEGETAKINSHTVLVDKKKKMLSDNHAKEFRYATSDKEVATVSLSGKIKATGKGSCIIYVYGKNGNAKKINVKVK